MQLMLKLLKKEKVSNVSAYATVYSMFNGNSRIFLVREYANHHTHNYDVVCINCLYVKFAYLIIM